MKNLITVISISSYHSENDKAEHELHSKNDKPEQKITTPYSYYLST